MPSKKRKYEARFPPARIKKIMQTDEEIGKVAAAVPIIISRSLEIFLQSLVETTARYTNERKAKTMTTFHLKHCIENEKKFDFLKDLVTNIADIANQEEEEGGNELQTPKKQRKQRAPTGERKKRKKDSSSDGEESDPNSEANNMVETPQPSPPSAMMTSSAASSLQRTSHSIDSIMSNSNQPSSSNLTPSFHSFQENSQSRSSPISLPMRMNLPASFQQSNNDEDDDYDT